MSHSKPANDNRLKTGQRRTTRDIDSERRFVTFLGMANVLSERRNNKC